MTVHRVVHEVHGTEIPDIVIHLRNCLVDVDGFWCLGIYMSVYLNVSYVCYQFCRL
jgi:hypothetical protein